MQIGDRIKLFIGDGWKDFICVAIKETDERDCIFFCEDNQSIVREIPEWLADLC